MQLRPFEATRREPAAHPCGVEEPAICKPHPKCWLELTDRQHRYAKNLRTYYREWERLDAAGKIAQLLATPAGLWHPDGIDAARERLEALEQAEEAAAGLEDEEVDERLWRGAYDQGWRVYIKGKRNDGHYWYVTPTGRRLGSKTEALPAR